VGGGIGVALTFANKITIGRILVVPFFISTVLYYTPEKDYLRFVALAVFLLAVMTDFIDGYIARTRHEKTKAGAILDPFADKILLMSAFICLYKIGVFFNAVRFPIWFVVAVISRDLILIFGSVIIQLVHGDLLIEPTRWGKANTFFQVSSVIGFLVQWPFTFFLWDITIVLTVISGIDYIRRGIKVINKGVSAW